MEQSTETKKRSNQRLIIILLGALIVLLAAVLAVVLVRGALQSGDEPTQQLGYATEATVMLDEDSLQAAIDEAMENAKNGMVALQYQNDAFSEDGKTFSCLIANSASNLYDMFLTIYADDALTDQLFLSALVPPGSGFEEITLDHALDPGDHVVYVVVTQVETDDSGAQAIKNQVIHTIKFHVAENA